MSKVIIIAEAGVNHNGNMQLAKQLVDIAAEAGADFVKFQTFIADNLVSREAKMASYQQKNTSSSETQLQMLQRLELDEKMHLELIAYCESKSINFLSTAFDIRSIHLLQKLGVEIGKIPSGEINNFPYLSAASDSFKKIILSSGMATLKEIEEAISVFIKKGKLKENISVLHCNTEYPTPFEDVNLMAMETIRRNFGVNVGYSDHTMGIEVAIAAVALGASIIEKHFTVDRNLDGPDHKASLEPKELQQMVRSIRNIEKALGSAVKKASFSEYKNISLVRKSIVASKAITKGETFTENNITTKRPGTGLSPMLWNEVIGKEASKNFEPDDFIKL